MESERTYSEEQVKDILMKAVHLQQQGVLETGQDPNGLSREQLAKMAAELGIDAQYLDAAIDQSRVSHKEDKGVSILGVPFSRTHHVVVEGELDPERFDVVVPELGSPSMGAQVASTSQVGRSLNARVAKGLAFGPVSVVARDGKTKIEARQMAFVGFMMGLYPALITSLVLGLNIARRGNPVAALATVVGLLAIGTGAFAWLARAGDRAMREIVKRIADVVADETRAQGVRENLARPTGVRAESSGHVEDRA